MDKTKPYPFVKIFARCSADCARFDVTARKSAGSLKLRDVTSKPAGWGKGKL
jgi:hypothetical protein